MKKKNLVFPAVFAGLWLAAGAVQAQGVMSFAPSLYVGGDAMLWERDRDGPGKDADSTGLRLRGGVAVNDYLAVEGHLATGGSDGSVELDDLIGIFARLSVPLASQFRVYGLVGATQVELGVNEDNDMSYGGGASLDIMPNLAVGADYIRYLDESSFTFDAASVGLTYRF